MEEDGKQGSERTKAGEILSSKGEVWDISLSFCRMKSRKAHESSTPQVLHPTVNVNSHQL
jgi:hypothetical protein